MGGDGGVIAAKREYMQSCGDVLGTKGDGKKPLNRTETAELRTKVTSIFFLPKIASNLIGCVPICNSRRGLAHSL